MSEAALAISNEDPVLGTDFAKEMVRQMRAVDTYGTYDEWPVEKILDPFVLTKEKKQEIPVVGDPDEIVMSRVKAFYNALSAMIEKECGLMAVPMLNLTHEGFGRAIITVGKLVVMDKTLRDVHRFGFPTLSKMKDEADKLLSVALEIVGQYPKVAGM
ncbi:MAG: NifX-associated nitrogen fixation protein [Candidatus Thiodiazotropha endolucinida]|nr:NifX-associated nitrogen fixation protein [Candidatus Thiodiazotropha sp. (ex Lucina pensylvanica)]MCG7876225.1 NifX-associated nitrogen fixation protein [Candidatus Thiodiazotropha taylori]MCG8025160.1 NifX-associated nitrogen fixation protein [Candidatus Thiodiazotropha endolucinida]MCG7882227.1 NifX-associated nitrogen fixation protein [Candidatus Thiodiazotropha taylori]MCG7885732.1 NifX-associated nitrogen fixation protein [Candidatus Thiodiazotropha taylori]